jgi:hypothetical protein
MEESSRMTAAFALESRATATSIRGGGLTEGPFVEDEEVVPGFHILEAADLDTALAIAGRNPVIRQGGGVEVRPVAGSIVRDPRAG